jgi:hypothetical protein
MAQDLLIKDKELTRNTILAYLIEHPDARDTLEGILQWWLLHLTINYQMSKVQEAINELVAKGYLIENVGSDRCKSYQINKNRLEEISAVMKREFA